MSAYSLDHREKIVESVKKGLSKSEIAGRFRDRSRYSHTLVQATPSVNTALCTNASFPRLAFFIHPAKDRFEPTT
jgi:hypothetical protein